MCNSARCSCGLCFERGHTLEESDYPQGSLGTKTIENSKKFLTGLGYEEGNSPFDSACAREVLYLAEFLLESFARRVRVFCVVTCRVWWGFGDLMQPRRILQVFIYGAERLVSPSESVGEGKHCTGTGLLHVCVSTSVL